jgi:hypothetical protein
MTIISLDEKPQGATFTGHIEFVSGAMWSLYKTVTGRYIWHVITAQREMWREEVK